MKDHEINDLKIVNEGGLLKTDEFNRAQLGEETFSGFSEQFISKEENEGFSELNDISDKKENKKASHQNDSSKQSSNAANSVATNVATSAMTSVLPGIIASIGAAIAVIGGATGLIQVKPSNNVSIFMSRSNALGFVINKEAEKTYKMLLTNAEYNFSQELTYTDHFVFENLIPNTVYDLTVYDVSVEPMEKVFSSNYMTKGYDSFAAYVPNSVLEGDELTFTVEYEGENINYVTIVVEGDNGKPLYQYEGAPINEFTVNVAGNENVSCRVSINGEVTYFKQLLTEEIIIPVESVSLDKEALSLKVGNSESLVASILPADTTNKDLIWSSSDDEVATVNQSGLVTAVNEGEATITVKSVSEDLTATCVVTVSKDIPVVHVASISLDKAELDLLSGDKYTFAATVLPADANDKSISWSSSDEGVVKVSNRGVVTAIGEGTATITATTKDGGLNASCVINVTQKVVPVNGISLDYDELELDVGKTQQLTAKVLPTNASNKEVVWNSNDESVATVDENGLVTAIKTGETIITVTSVDGEYQDYCIINVK